MNQLDTNPKAPENASFAMIATLGIIAMLSGLFVVSIFQFTKPYIEENQRIATQQGIFKVVPGAVKYKEFIVTKDGIYPASSSVDGVHVYAAYDKDGKLLGVAARSAAQGYADLIHLLYGYDPSCECIRGIKVLKTAETPGLGDKIVSDKAFLKNFEALDARLNADKSGLANAIVTVKHGTKKHDWEIDAISGATISSRAVGKAIDISAEKIVPLLQRYIDVLKNGLQNDGGKE